jgi:hypothetical protein
MALQGAFEKRERRSFTAFAARPSKLAEIAAAVGLALQRHAVVEKLLQFPSLVEEGGCPGRQHWLTGTWCRIVREDHDWELRTRTSEMLGNPKARIFS